MPSKQLLALSVGFYLLLLFQFLLFLTYEDFVTFEYHDKSKAFRQCVEIRQNTLDCLRENTEEIVYTDDDVTQSTPSSKPKWRETIMTVLKPKIQLKAESVVKLASNSSKFGTNLTVLAANSSASEFTTGSKNFSKTVLVAKSSASEFTTGSKNFSKTNLGSPKNTSFVSTQSATSIKKMINVIIYKSVSKKITERVDDIVNRLTIDEIVNLTIVTPDLVDVSKRLNITSFVTKECSSGMMTSPNATAFPNGLAMAATFSPEAIFRVAQAISKEVRGYWNDNVKQKKYHTFYGVNCLSPTLDLMRHPLWGRNQETFGEDPYLSGALAAKYIAGIQGMDRRYVRVAATCKHFAVHGGPEFKAGKFDAKVSQRDLHMSYLPNFKKCVAAGALGLMCANNKVNGIPACANERLLKDIARTTWNFKGFVMSDSAAIQNFHTTHKFMATPKESAAAAIKAGCNLEMTSQEPVYSAQREAMKSGLLTETDLRENIKPMFYTRMRLGEFDRPHMNPYNSLNTSVVQSSEHRELAIQVAMMSFVLLKNINGVLPITKKLKKIAVVGPFANQVRTLYGSLAPQPNTQFAQTPLDGLKKLADDIQFAEGCKDVECKDYNVEEVRTATNGIEMVFVCLGTTEVQGKDRVALNLPGKQLKLLQDATRGRSKFPVILLLFNGGPLDITWAKSSDRVHAILELFFPAQSTGEALYRILTKSGPHSVPAGRLPCTWPAAIKDVPSIENYNLSSSGWTYRYLNTEPLYPFGYGLSYTQFHYQYVNVEPPTITAGHFVKATVGVTNLGPHSGDEVLQVYLSWVDVKTGVPKWTLVAARRIFVKVNDEAKFDFTIKDDQMAVWTEEKGMQVIPGKMQVFAGGQQPHQSVVAESNVVTSYYTINPR